MQRLSFMRTGGFSLWLTLGMALALSGLNRCRADEPLPEASEVTRRILERAQAVAQAGQEPQYTFESHEILEELNARGEVTESEEKIYHVEWIAGFPFKRLVQVKGRDLSPEELKEQQKEEERFREKITSVRPSKMLARRESVVTARLLDRYHFEVKERVFLDHRPTLVVAFQAKDGPVDGGAIVDRILSRLEGTLWVDEADADTAKLALTLREPLTLGWLGILGSLTGCDYVLERRRMPDGIWLNKHQVLHLQYRKLATTLRFRKVEISQGFAKAQ